MSYAHLDGLASIGFLLNDGFNNKKRGTNDRTRENG